MIAPVFCYGDIAANEAAGKLSALLTVEEGGVCGGEMEKLHTLYALGVRMLTLTWNYPNELGFPHHYRAEESFKGTGNFREIKKETENAGSGLTKKRTGVCSGDGAHGDDSGCVPPVGCGIL